MSAPGKRRLGKGLEALLGPSLNEAISDDTLVELPVATIRPNPFQPRRHFDATALDELVRSIQTSGLMQPVVVRAASDGQYELVAGERRWRAVQQLGWPAITALVRSLDNRSMLTLALIENLQRDDLSPIDEARGYAQLINDFGHSQQEIATAVGRDRSTVANALRLLKLPEAVQTMLQHKELDVGHARALLALGDPQRIIELAGEAAREGLSVRDVEARTRQGRDKPARSRPRAAAAKSEEVRRVEDVLRRRLQTDVYVKLRGKGGRLELAFYSNEDLARLLELVLGEPFS